VPGSAATSRIPRQAMFQLFGNVDVYFLNVLRIKQAGGTMGGCLAGIRP
jgi:hypothetical protein